MNAPRPSDPLKSFLAEWRLQPVRNPQFRAKVWSRLEGGGSEHSWRGYARRHALGVGGAVALGLLTGAFGGYERARAHAAAESAQLAAAYVQGMDARLMEAP